MKNYKSEIINTINERNHGNFSNVQRKINKNPLTRLARE